MQVRRQLERAADPSWMPPCNPQSGRECSEREKQVAKSWMSGPRRQAEDALLELQGKFDALAGSVWSNEKRLEKLEDINVLTKLLYGSK
jgi:hypothetical protein